MVISTENLKPGMVVTSNVYYNGNSFIPLLTAGTVLDENKIRMIHEKNIKKISIDMVNETIPNALQTYTAMAIKKLDLNAAYAFSKEIIYNILKENEFIYGLDKYQLVDDQEYLHAVNVAAFAVKLAKHYNVKASSKEYLNFENVALTALFHNIGIVFENKDKFKKLIPVNLDKRIYTKYDNKCFKEYDASMSNIYTYSMLTNSIGIDVPEQVKEAILLLNEKDDGTGILGKKKTNKENSTTEVIAKIVHLCDTYDYLLYKCRQANQTPSNAMELLEYFKENNEVDHDLTELFVNYIPLYSRGLNVTLSNGYKAKVMEYDNDKPTHPTVLINLKDNHESLKNVIYEENNVILSMKIDKLKKAYSDNNFVEIKMTLNDILNEISSTGFRINFSKFKEYDQMDHLINVCITAMFIGSKYNRFKNEEDKLDCVSIGFKVLNNKLSSVGEILNSRKDNNSMTDEIINYAKIYDLVTTNCLKNNLSLFMMKRYVDEIVMKNDFNKYIVSLYNQFLPLLKNGDQVILDDDVIATITDYDLHNPENSNATINLKEAKNITISGINDYNDIYIPVYSNLKESMSNEKRH